MDHTPASGSHPPRPRRTTWPTAPTTQAPVDPAAPARTAAPPTTRVPRPARRLPPRRPLPARRRTRLTPTKTPTKNVPKKRKPTILL